MDWEYACWDIDLEQRFRDAGLPSPGSRYATIDGEVAMQIWFVSWRSEWIPVAA